MFYGVVRSWVSYVGTASTTVVRPAHCSFWLLLCLCACVCVRMCAFAPVRAFVFFFLFYIGLDASLRCWHKQGPRLVCCSPSSWCRPTEGSFSWASVSCTRCESFLYGSTRKAVRCFCKVAHAKLWVFLYDITHRTHKTHNTHTQTNDKISSNGPRGQKKRICTHIFPLLMMFFNCFNLEVRGLSSSHSQIKYIVVDFRNIFGS